MLPERDVVIRLEDAELGYGRETILARVSLEIAAGEFWFVLGRNGSGKTTLIRTLLGLLPPRDGLVWRDEKRASLERIGFVPQHCSISPALPTTVREFVSLGAVGAQRPASGRSADLEWALESAGLEAMGHRSYWALSGGQRQRALVARALVRRPALLVLDEPTEGMDVGSASEFLATLDASNRAGETILCVTHDVNIAARHATHVALTHEGHIHSGTWEEIRAAREMEIVFGAQAGALASRPGGAA